MNEYKQHSFDVYCKTILRHAAANAYKSKRRRAARIIPFSGLSESDLQRLCAYDSYSVDKQTYTTYGGEVEIEHDGLCAALEHLGRSQRDILLLSYCFDFTDAEIGELLSIPRSTVQYRRSAALDCIRKFLEVDDGSKKDLSE